MQPAAGVAATGAGTGAGAGTGGFVTAVTGGKLEGATTFSLSGAIWRESGAGATVSGTP
jgi:hypothetical protein